MWNAFQRQQVGRTHKSCRGRQIVLFAICLYVFADMGAVPFLNAKRPSAYAQFPARPRRVPARPISWR